MNSEIISQSSPWYILLCAGLGIFFAFISYYRSSVFTKNQKWFLATLRTILGFAVAYLLLSPLVKTVSSLILKPKVVVLVDDSKSMLKGGNLKDALSNLMALKKDIEGKGYEVEVNNLEGEPLTSEEIKNFQNKKTNLAAALNFVKNNYEGQNLSDVILFSDGIINDGVSPTFSKYPFNVHTVGFGDTTIKKDAFISGISANKIAYLGNNFSVAIDVGSYLLKGKSAQLTINDSQGNLLSQKVVSYAGDDSFQTVNFELSAKAVGKQRFVVQLQVVGDEVTASNNHREFIVDVINGKEKILLLAYAPHPDIKAIKSIIESNDLFELNVKIVQQADLAPIRNEVFDVLILHQFPDVENLHTQFLGALLARQKPTFFILGSKTNLSYFNGMQNIVGINSQPGKVDKVTAKVNPAFKLFNITSQQADLISSLPPVTVPFGSYILQGGTETVLGQFVSGVNASRPLLAINLSGTRKMAAFMGDGLWQWRMEEYGLSNSHQNLDDLIVKTLQLISVKEDKSKLRVYPVADVFEIEQRVSFVAEAYNEIFERIYGQNIQLKITSNAAKSRDYEFKITEESSRFDISDLAAGVYNYEASSLVNGKQEKVTGQFVVTQTDLENQNTVANFALLRTLANENNGDFVLAKNSIELRNVLEKRGLVNKLIAQEDLKDLINLRWLLLFILVFASVEWVFRKYWGNY